MCAGTESDRAASHLLTPRAWFWHRVDVPVLPEGENDTITDNDRTRRVRGRELADLLCGECFICSLTRSVCIMNV